MRYKVDFATVIPAVQAGDKVAQDALMKGFYGWTVLYAKRIVKDFDLAADIAVSYWTWLYQKGGIQKYDGAIPAFTWIRQQLRDHLRDYLRYRHDAPVEYQAAPEDVAGGDTPEEVELARDMQVQIETGLNPQEIVILRTLLSGQDARAVAKVLDVPTQRARDLISALRAKIRDNLT